MSDKVSTNLAWLGLERFSCLKYAHTHMDWFVYRLSTILVPPSMSMRLLEGWRTRKQTNSRYLLHVSTRRIMQIFEASPLCIQNQWIELINWLPPFRRSILERWILGNFWGFVSHSRADVDSSYTRNSHIGQVPLRSLAMRKRSRLSTTRSKRLSTQSIGTHYCTGLNIKSFRDRGWYVTRRWRWRFRWHAWC